MHINIHRQTKTSACTLGIMDINGIFECYTLEGTDLGLKQEMPLSEITSLKVNGHTAIPAGIYEVTIDFSEHFGKALPHILNVSGFENIRIHNGNTEKQMEGCILLGTDIDNNTIGNTRVAFGQFYPKLQEALGSGKVFITIN